jgi:hypothetical protein
LQDISSRIRIVGKNAVHEKISGILMSKSSRSTLTSPSGIRVNYRYYTYYLSSLAVMAGPSGGKTSVKRLLDSVPLSGNSLGRKKAYS